jgi:hypothetical protein
MKTRQRLGITVALTFALLSGGPVLGAGPNRAGTLASALLLSTDAERLDCFLSNVGPRAVVIPSVFVRNGGNLLLSLSFNTCDTLAPGGNCAFSADLDARFSARGVVEVDGGVEGLRGQCQLTTAANELIATTELR